MKTNQTLSQTGKKYAAASLLVLGIAATTGVGTVFAADHANGEHGGKRGAKLEIAANLLGTTVAELEAKVAAGEDIRTLLEDAGISKDDMKEARMQAVIERLNQKVADGTITQEQADERIDRMAERAAQRDSIREAVATGDFATWSQLVEGRPIAEKVTEANFSKLTEASQLREAGDREGAKAILSELGIERKGKRGHGQHDGWSQSGQRQTRN